MRRSLPRLIVVFLLAALFSVIGSARVFAQEQAGVAAMPVLHVVPAAVANVGLFPAAPVATAAATLPGLRPSAARFENRRPMLLPALYASTALLQALDAHSTMAALDKGAREANPLMQGVVQHRGTLLAVKAGVAASTIYLAEKMWKRNRLGAIAMMVVVNGIDAAIVAHNYKVASSLR